MERVAAHLIFMLALISLCLAVFADPASDSNEEYSHTVEIDVTNMTTGEKH